MIKAIKYIDQASDNTQNSLTRTKIIQLLF